MSFSENKVNQVSLDDSVEALTHREKGILSKSWAQEFSERIFPLIDERRYSVLYSEKASRPNTPVNVIIGSLVLKELLELTDDELMESMLFDVRFQYALHTTSFKEQPLSDKTLCRFRARCYEHELNTGEDLIHESVTELSGAMAQLMQINGRLKRMDSLMVSSNIKKLSRLELIYTCVSNLAVYLHKSSGDELLAGLEHYYDPADYNRVIYHNRSTETEERMTVLLSDASLLLSRCGENYTDVKEYGLLSRVIREQTIAEPDGKLRLRSKADGGMDSNILQNPSDPDATYREKAGKQYRGYSANLLESVGENGSIIEDYQYETNTHSDSEFLKEAIEELGEQSEKTIIVTDGAYSSVENGELAAGHNIELVSTSLTGRETKDIYADFEFSEDGETVVSCPSGHAPKSSGKPNSNGQCRVSFDRKKCESCPHKDDCQPKISNKTAVIHISKKSVSRAISQRQMKTEESKELYKFRNGVESLPSTLRRKYNVDNMPVRGKIRTKLWFGFKVAALNFKKTYKYLSSLPKCAQNPVNA